MRVILNHIHHVMKINQAFSFLQCATKKNGRGQGTRLPVDTINGLITVYSDKYSYKIGIIIVVALTLLQNGWTPLMTAVDNNHVDMVKLLLDNGAKIDIADDVRKLC